MTVLIAGLEFTILNMLAFCPLKKDDRSDSTQVFKIHKD